MTLPERRTVAVGPVLIGGGHPISVQTMTKVPTDAPAAVLQQLHSCRNVTPQTLCERDQAILHALGVFDRAAALGPVSVDLIRLAVPTPAAARALPAIIADSPVPIVADIHFNHRLALDAIAAGVAKVRLNPGNITDPGLVTAIGQACIDTRTPLRIGTNAGSVEAELLQLHGGNTAAALLHSTLRSVERMQALGLEQLVVSLKVNSAADTIRLYRQLARRTDLPLHVGVTEAGLGPSAIINSTVGIGVLLRAGIGDTIRVSLTETPALETLIGHLIIADQS